MTIERNGKFWEIELPLGTSGDNYDLEAEMLEVFTEAFELWCRKQAAYGSQNISRGGLSGIWLRVNDKVQRLKTLMATNSSPTWEGQDDTWLDIAVYGIMALLVRRGQWPKPKEDANACPYCMRVLEAVPEVYEPVPLPEGGVSSELSGPGSIGD